MGHHWTKIETDRKWPEFIGSKNEICSREVNVASKVKNFELFFRQLDALPSPLKKFSILKPIFAKSTKIPYFWPNVSILVMTRFPNRDFGPKWLKSFLFTCRMRREREKMDVNQYLKKYLQNKICYFYYCYVTQKG